MLQAKLSLHSSEPLSKSDAQRLCISTFSSLAACQEQKLEKYQQQCVSPLELGLSTPNVHLMNSCDALRVQNDRVFMDTRAAQLLQSYLDIQQSGVCSYLWQVTHASASDYHLLYYKFSTALQTSFVVGKGFYFTQVIHHCYCVVRACYCL